ncbi:hypothetical protein HanIR_Chr15g0747531 [Helianthus annuus]|nr:hypothetical protein HanIR_Chr15g0747531 [Helianthus annuus]
MSGLTIFSILNVAGPNHVIFCETIKDDSFNHFFPFDTIECYKRELNRDDSFDLFFLLMNHNMIIHRCESTWI